MITLAGLPCTYVRLRIPQRGVWTADVELDLVNQATGANDPIPSGQATLAFDNDTLVGTIDAEFAARFGATGRLRMLGGASGWASSLVSRQWFNQSGLISTTVYAATASEVGETVIDPDPVAFGTDYVRAAGPASSVFGGRPWRITPDGITHVDAWPTPAPPSDLEVLAYDPLTQTLTATSSSVLYPGLRLIDGNGRWDGTITVGDVEQVFDPHTGSRAVLYTAITGGNRLIQALGAFVRNAHPELASVYRYRLVSQSGSKLTVQAVDAAVGAPDGVQLQVFGPGGYVVQYAPGTELAVAFLNSDPTVPRAIAFDDTPVMSVAIGGPGAQALGLGAALNVIIQAFAAATPSMTETGLASIKAALAAYFTSPATWQTTKVTAA